MLRHPLPDIVFPPTDRSSGELLQQAIEEINRSVKHTSGGKFKKQLNVESLSYAARSYLLDQLKTTGYKIQLSKGYITTVSLVEDCTEFTITYEPSIDLNASIDPIVLARLPKITEPPKFDSAYICSEFMATVNRSILFAAGRGSTKTQQFEIPEVLSFAYRKHIIEQLSQYTVVMYINHIHATDNIAKANTFEVIIPLSKQ